MSQKLTTNSKLGTSSRSTKGGNGVLSEDASVQEGTSPKVQGRDSEDADQSQMDRHKSKTK